MRPIFLAFATISFSVIVQRATAQNFDSVQIKTYKMTESIYMLEGDGGNIGLLAGKDGAVMIDDQFAPLTEKIKNAIKKVSYLIMLVVR